VFQIRPEDLLANRAGQLSTRQSRRLRRSARRNLLTALLMVLGIVAVLFVLAAKPLAWLQYTLAGVVAVGGVAVGLVTVRGLLAAARAGTVMCLTGPVRVAFRGKSGWWLSVQEQSFRLPVRFWHVADSLPYRVYVAPAAGRIVAMEPGDGGWSEANRI
jgi:hypothetical protein